MCLSPLGRVSSSPHVPTQTGCGRIYGDVPVAPPMCQPRPSVDGYGGEEWMCLLPPLRVLVNPSVPCDPDFPMGLGR